MEDFSRLQALTQLKAALSNTPDGEIYSNFACINQTEFSTVLSGKRADERVILKLFHGSSKAQIVERLQRELKNVSSHMRTPAFRVNPCIATYPPQGLAVLGFVPGKTIAEHLKSAPPAQRQKLIAGSGAWLQSYIGHRKSVKTFPTLKWKNKLETTILPQMQADKQFVCEHLLQALASQLPQLDGAATAFAASHGDFVAKNLILNGDAIYGVDIHCKTVIPIVHDLARFLVWLQTEHPQPRQTMRCGLFSDDLRALTNRFADVAMQNEAIFKFFIGYQIFLRMVNMRGNTAVYTRAAQMMAHYLTNDQGDKWLRR